MTCIPLAYVTACSVLHCTQHPPEDKAWHPDAALCAWLKVIGCCAWPERHQRPYQLLVKAPNLTLILTAARGIWQEFIILAACFLIISAIIFLIHLQAIICKTL